MRGKEAFGTFTENLPKTRKILSVLCTFIQTTQTSALICLGDKSGSSAVTVLSHDNSMYIFDSHSTVSFICELADCLAARLFHWTFWHSIPSTDCNCNTSFGRNVAPVDMLSEQEILNLYFENVATVSQKSDRRNYYQSHKQKA